MSRTDFCYASIGHIIFFLDFRLFRSVTLVRTHLSFNANTNNRYSLSRLPKTAVLHHIDPDYARVWTSYRRLRLVIFVLFFAAMVELVYGLFLPGMLFALIFVAYFFCSAVLACWKCPRCGQPFFRFAFYRSLFGGKCFYCDLPKWSVSESGNVIWPPQFLLRWKRPVMLNKPKWSGTSRVIDR